MRKEEEIKRGGIPYRATCKEDVPSDPDKGIRWEFTYQVLPDRFWRPRGYFYEKDGVFHYSGKEFDSAYSALAFRVHEGI